jgi:two-component system sensor histidine kinase KdpD
LAKIHLKNLSPYFFAVGSIVFVTMALVTIRHHINPTTVALALLLVVLFSATLWGSKPAMLASLVGMLCFNFFFLPLVGTFTIADPENWIALAAFVITAITAGQLSARAKRRAEEAETQKREIERLYKELQNAFEQASHAEALRRSERLKSALLDAVTHDLRTPLTSIKASVTTLLDESESEGKTFLLDAESRKEFLEVINEETDRLNHFIESMVELARIEAGDMQLFRSWSSVEKIISLALERAKPLTRNHRVTVTIENELPSVRVDSRTMSEVVYALVDNAAKYSAHGTEILVEAKRFRDDMISIAVEDEGVGVSEKMRERVFEKFYRANDADERQLKTKGFGMGLAISRGIVEAHGGKIRIEDKIGQQGTRIIFIIPIGDDE